MSVTMNKSFKTQQQQQQQRVQFKQAAALPRVAVRSSRRQQPVTKALLTTIPRVADRSSGSNDSGSSGNLRVMSLISSLVDIEVSILCFVDPFTAGECLCTQGQRCLAVTPNSFPAPGGVPPTHVASACCHPYHLVA
jgi:hypothetical protein